MKNLILITLLFIAFNGKAQTTKPIDGFLGIKFGSTQAQVIEALKAKGATVNPGQSAYSVSFSNVSLGGRKAIVLFVHFVNNQVFEALFVFKPDLEAKSIELYNSLVNDVNTAYGNGNATKKFKQPYTDGDGYELTAIKTGNADFETYWEDTANGKNNIAATIEVTASKTITVKLYYDSGTLRKLYDEQQKAKNKSEF